jgi:hypothetical protein
VWLTASAVWIVGCAWYFWSACESLNDLWCPTGLSDWKEPIQMIQARDYVNLGAILIGPPSVAFLIVALCWAAAGFKRTSN